MLGDAAGRVFRLRHISDLPQEVDVRKMHVDRFARDIQRRVRLLNLVHDLRRPNGDVALGERDVLLLDGRPQRALPAAGEILAEHQHVHVRVGWI